MEGNIDVIIGLCTSPTKQRVQSERFARSVHDTNIAGRLFHRI